jgi:hypothetical protein
MLAIPFEYLAVKISQIKAQGHPGSRSLAFACLTQDRRAISPVMKSLANIEAAADSLPPQQKEELLRFLAERLRQQATPSTYVAPSPAADVDSPSQKGVCLLLPQT